MAKKKAADATTPKATKKAAKKSVAKAAAPAAPAVKATAAKKTVAKAPAKKSAAKKAPAIKLTDAQRAVLAKVHTAGETGYNFDLKAEQRTLESLKTKKMLKTGKKDKATGKAPYHITKAGEKALSTPSA